MEGENGAVILYVDPFKAKDAAGQNEVVAAWAQAAKQLRTGRSVRRNLTADGTAAPSTPPQRRVKVSSQALSDMLVDALKEDDNKK